MGIFLLLAIKTEQKAIPLLFGNKLKNT